MTEAFQLVKEFTFEAAHFLPRAPESHKCRRLHGHSYRIAVLVEGPVDATAGWVMDFGEISAAVTPIRARLDHRVLNDIDGLENPTSEHLAAWIFHQLTPRVPGLSAITVHETNTTRCTYRRLTP